ncbi:MAG: thioredoxin [Streptomycetaceae bacterium]|nr:MAG: thioredoxin [Streptomycetaceae bacterium]
MSTLNLTNESFASTILKNGIVLVDFWAAWCGPCRMFAPIFDAASGKYPEITFGKVDTEAERELAGSAGITSIPTLMAFKDGILVFSQPGAMPAPSFDELINAVQALDMDEVRAKIKEEEAAK